MDEIDGVKVTSRMRRALKAAADEARKRGHDHIGTGHMVLGLLAEPYGIAAQTLEQIGAATPARESVEAIIESPRYLAPVADPELRAELLWRRELDQSPRRVEPRKASVEEMRRVAEENTAWLKAVIAEHGWPGVRMVGSDGADVAWLLAQHADHDLDFQRECLALLEKAVEAHDAYPRHLAYLADRVLIKEGKPQRYGTQFRGSEPFPIEAPEDVDERRAAVGLEPLADYAKHFQRYADTKPEPGKG